VASEDGGVRRLVHDLRSPVAVVEGFAQLLQRNGEALTPEQRADYLRRIVEAAGEIKAALDGAGRRAAG
jgi:K+-sensing histidine kinase KdpD